MAKVIDALVVTLGLDSSGYKKGAADAKTAQADLKAGAVAETKSTQTSTEKSGAAVKKLGAEKRKQEQEEKKRQRDAERARREQGRQEQSATDASIDRIKGVGLAVAGAVLGFNTLKGALQSYVGATNQLANLGRVAPTIGTDVKSLDKLGDAYKMVGGKADEAGSDIAKLSHAQFSFAINAPDAMAGWARRLGVSLFDAKGNARDKIQIQEDIASALKRQTSDLQTQAMYAREMGMSESFIQLYLVKQSAERAKILADAEKTAQATADAAKNAQAQEAAVSRLKNRLKAVGENIVATVSPTVTRVLNAVADAGDNASTTSGERTLKSLGLVPKQGGSSAVRATPYDQAFRATERKYGLPNGLLKAVAHRESNFNPNAQSVKNGVTVGAGLMQLNPKFFANAGKDANADIDEAARELSRLYKSYRKLYGEQTALKLVLAAYNDGQGNVNKAIKKGTQLPAETRNYVPAVQNYTAAIAASTAPAGATAAPAVTTNTTHIEQLNVHTAATDAAGIAQSLPDAMRRQNLVAQGNSGLQ